MDVRALGGPYATQWRLVDDLFNDWPFEILKDRVPSPTDLQARNSWARPRERFGDSRLGLGAGAGSVLTACLQDGGPAM